MGRRRALRRPSARRIALYEAHLPIVDGYVFAFGAWKAKAAGIELDDLRQAARLGMWQAALRFDFRRGTAFSTLARYAMHWAMHDALDAAKYGKKPRHRPLIDQSAFRRLPNEDTYDD